jgi:hypothetical protein
VHLHTGIVGETDPPQVLKGHSISLLELDAFLVGFAELVFDFLDVTLGAKLNYVIPFLGRQFDSDVIGHLVHLHG